MALFKTDNIKKINFEAIPDEMKNTPQWFLWKHVDTKGNGTLQKIPHNLKGTKWVSYTNDKSLSSFDEVKQAYHTVAGAAGVGFKPKGTDITIVDIDIERDKQTGEVIGQLTASEKHILNAGYVETSVSGNGYHAIFNHKPHESIGDKVYIYDDNEHQIEVYHTNVKGWVAITGDIHDNHSQIDNKEISKEFIDYIMGTFKPKHTERYTGHLVESGHLIPPDIPMDEVVPKWLDMGNAKLIGRGIYKKDLWHMAANAIHAYSSRSEALYALMKELAYFMWDNPQGLSELLYSNPDWLGYLHNDRRPQLVEDEINKAINERISSGKLYEGYINAEDEFFEFIPNRRSDDYWEAIAKGVSGNKRSSATASIMGKLLKCKVPDGLNYWLISHWNESNDPPLDKDTIDDIIISIFNKHHNIQR